MMIAHTKMRIGLIGLGDIAEKAYLPIVAKHAQITPVICTRNKRNLDRIAHQYGISEAYTNIDELIASQPNAVMVHSATESHFEIVKKMLEAQIPVFVDKPLCYTLEACNELLELSVSNQTLLYVGFNRRFAPMIQTIAKHKMPLQISWQKNRTNLPGKPREFIFDDFIHVIDSLLYLANGEVVNLQVKKHMDNELLLAVMVQWEQNGTWVQGSMNRVSGYTQEVIDYQTFGNSWQVNDFSTCIHQHNDRHEILSAGSWDSALLKKGFHHMIDDWLEALSSTSFNYQRVENIRTTHELCEKVLQLVLATNTSPKSN